MSISSSISNKRSGWTVFGEPASLRMLALGFAAGLPLPLVLSTLSFWLREAGIDRKTIGFLSWVGLAYGFKWAWAPLVDRLPIPFLTRRLGRRRSWLLVAQGIVSASLAGLAFSNPQASIQLFTIWAVAVAFGSATQDIVLDAFRIESAGTERQAALAATYQTGYRIAMIWAGAGALWIAARVGGQGYSGGAWRAAYLAMAASMGLGMLTVLLSPEPTKAALPPARTLGAWVKGALFEPFADFIRRYRWQAILILALISLYRIADVVMGIMANPFYVDMGFTKDQVAAVSKVYGLLMTLAGAFLGGWLSLRFGVLRILLVGAILTASSNLLFAWLAHHGHDTTALIFVVSADNLASGLASAAFIAYLSSLTSLQYSATQYALFSSLMMLFPKFLAGFSGVFVNQFGYSTFFIGTALLGLPVIGLIALADRLLPDGSRT